MAYSTEDLFKTAMKQIEKHNLFFIEDIIAFMPCAKSTFYEHFPNYSDNYKRMFEALENNRTAKKVQLRKKWGDSDAPALQMALMKLICEDHERKKLSMQYQETELKGSISTDNRFSFEDIPEDEIFNLADKMQKAEFERELEAKEKKEE